MLIMAVVIIIAALLALGLYLLAARRWAKQEGAALPGNYKFSLLVLLLLYSVLFAGYQLYSNMQLDWAKQASEKKIAQLKQEQRKEIDKITATYVKEMGFLEWKNKVFTSNADLDKSISKAEADYKLSPDEVSMWRGVAENNTLEKLIPKKKSEDVLKEYQGRLKKSLAQIRSGQTLMTSDVRVLSENINTIRLIGKEYEKVLDTFKDLYTGITSNSGVEPVEPKQKYFMFFPVKRKEYEQLLKEYHEAKGNQSATAEVAIKLKAAIEKAETEMKSINQKFDDNLAFVENNSNTISFNNTKLENLIEAAIREAEIIKENENKTQLKVKNTTN